MRASIQAALGAVPFTGLGVDYCTAVCDHLRPQLPGVALEVFHRHTELVVEARSGDVVTNVTLKLAPAT